MAGRRGRSIKTLSIQEILKLPLAQVVWIDAVGNTEWSDEDPPLEPAYIHTFGRVLKRVEDYVIYYTHSANSETDCREALKVPLGMVSKVIYLEPRKRKRKTA